MNRVVFLVGRVVLFSCVVGCLGGCLIGCLNQGSGSEGTTHGDGTPAVVKAPLTSPERTVCDPFQTGVSSRDHGIVGNMLYLTDDQPRYTSVKDYIANGVPVQSTLYFDKIFVPTRAFDLGFFTQTGTQILNQNNQALYEYFALRLGSQLSLAASQTPGWYQLATLSDDGAVLSLKNADGSMSTLINNDGTHPTRMGCANNAIYLDQNSRIPVVFEYYQGPRYHIALTLMWRPLPDGVDPSSAVSDVDCGQEGNSLYFDSTQVPSAPSPTYYNLLTRGWQPLGNENYYFPSQASNPCGVTDPLLITNFAVISSSRTSVTVGWVSSRAASTQIQIKNVITGQISLSSTDPTLVTNHSTVLSDLTANTLYAVSAVSVSSDGSAATSSELAFRTSR